MFFLLADNHIYITKYIANKNTYLIKNQQTIEISNEVQIRELINQKINKVNIIIPEEKSYLKLISFPKLEKISKTEIARESENYIPENIEEKNIYWEKVGENETEIIVSVRIIKNDYMKQLEDLFIKTKMKWNNIYFESEIIVKNNSDNNDPEIIIINKKNGVLILVSIKGKVWQSILVKKGKETDRINQIKLDFLNKWKIELKTSREEKNDLWTILQTGIKENDSYFKTVNFLFIAIILISLAILFVLIPMFIKNIKESQANIDMIQQMSKQ